MFCTMLKRQDWSDFDDGTWYMVDHDGNEAYVIHKSWQNDLIKVVIQKTPRIKSRVTAISNYIHEETLKTTT